jgi:hypothetical protein
VHFGVGEACTADVTVTWLGGAKKEMRGVAVDQVVKIERP